MNKLLLLYSLLFLYSCNPKSGVTINTSGIFKPFLYSIDGKNASGTILDYKEILLSDEPQILNLSIYNDSSYPYTDINVSFKNLEDTFPVINFNPNSDGNIGFPGMDGTCTTTLQPKKSCTVKLVLAPRDEKRYEEYVILKFKNLVDQEEHKATLSYLAGWPASLVFTNDTTNYNFGELIGLPAIPVVEREDSVTFVENITIKNAGGLSARKIEFNLNETCISSLLNHCPTGMFGAFSYEHNCPEKLSPNETCELTVSYLPKNKAPTPGNTLEEIKSINYKANLIVEYQKDSKNSEGALNAYFNSWSTNIQANFKSNLPSLTVIDPIISGNRDSKNFRVANNGFREGELKFLTVKDSANLHLADCFARVSSERLHCQDSANSELTLAQFPFTIKDLDQCLPYEGSTPKYVNVGANCNFEIIFQPSVTYLSDITDLFQNLQFQLTFDSRWKAAEKIEKVRLLDYSASSKSAAQVIVESINFGGEALTLSSTPATGNLGRLALQSKTYTQRKPILITFKNIGNEPARSIQLQDGKGQNIVIGGTTHLGTGSYRYFINTSASTNACTVIAPQDTCVLSTSFAPIGLTEAEEKNQMYDTIDEDDLLQSFKEFRFIYDSASRYTDSNRLDEPNYITDPTLARLKAHLIRKGLLMDMNSESFNKPHLNNITAGDEINYVLLLRNIGTGDIPYIRLMNPPGVNNSLQIISTTNPSAYGAQFDCKELIDIGTPTSTPIWPIPSGASFISLPPDQTCAYTLRHKKKNADKVLNATTCNNALTPTISSTDLVRFFSRSVVPEDLWQFCQSAQDENKIFSHSYFDGDVIDTSMTFGTSFSSPPFENVIRANSQANLLPTSYMPSLTATMYRPSIDYPTLIDTTFPAVTVPATWFYGEDTLVETQMDALSASTFLIQGDESRNVVITTNAYTKRMDYDYIYYVGSFPQELGTFNFPITILNMGDRAARIKNTNISNVLGNAFSYSGQYTINSNINGGNNVPSPIFSFNPSASPGEHQMEISLTYENNRALAPLIFNGTEQPINSASVVKQEVTLKILVVGLIEENYPKLGLKVTDIDVVQNVGVAPTETAQPPQNASLSWNNSALLQSLTFDTIKLSATPKIEDSYAKKVLSFENTSPYPIQDFRIIFRNQINDQLPRLNNPRFILTGNCTQGMTMPANTGCSITLYYQPNTTDLAENFVLSAVYSLGSSKYVSQNIGIELFPRAPGALVAMGKTTEVINYRATPSSSTITRSSYPMDIGANQIINSLPKTFTFDGSKKVLVVNTETTKTSLLLSYQRNLAKNSLRGFNPSSQVPVNVIPEASEYFSAEGGQYVVIHENYYSPENPRVTIAANKSCLFGDDENNAAVPFHEKGFNSTSLASCYLLFEFNANFSYINKRIVNSNPLDMMNVASELWYYSVKRSSSASIWFHFRGSLLPDTSFINLGISEVQPFDDRRVLFTLPTMSPSYSELGEIVGIRILMSNDKTKLNSPYDTTLSFKDFKPYNPDDPELIEWTTGLSNSQFFFFRPVAIRKHSKFVDDTPPRFVGLAANEYLSATSANIIVETLIPPVNHYYFHYERILVDKNLATSSLKSFADASATCLAKSINILYNLGDSRAKKYQLIDSVSWPLIAETPIATNYANLFSQTHWLSDAAVNLDATIGHYTGFIPGTSSQFLDAHKTFYIRDSQNPNTPVRKAEGGVLGGVRTNWTSYLNPNTPLAVPRCMINL